MIRTATVLIVSIFLMVCITTPDSTLSAQDTLEFCCSNQVSESFAKKNIEAFTSETGIKVRVRTLSSAQCAVRMMMDCSNLAGLARTRAPRHADYGYKQIPICVDPLAVIVNENCEVNEISAEQLQNIFSGNIKNWSGAGGPDLPILVIVPGEDTAANKNFRRQVMKRKEIKFDLMAHASTKVIEAIRYYPSGAISFVSYGAVYHHKKIKSLKIDGWSPEDEAYPYYQVYYYFTRGEPVGIVKRFIDFTLSEKGTIIMEENGMPPFTE